MWSECSEKFYLTNLHVKRTAYKPDQDIKVKARTNVKVFVRTKSVEGRKKFTTYKIPLLKYGLMITFLEHSSEQNEIRGCREDEESQLPYTS